MFNNRIFVELLKSNILNNGFNRIYKMSFAISTKFLQSTDDSTAKKSIQPINMAYNMFSHTDDNLNNNSPLIIMHGLFGSKQNWRTISKVLQKKLSPNRTIFAVDARNHGESPHHKDHTYDHLASDILEFFKQHNLNKAILMGHSMGGRAMMNFALNYPDHVEKLIVVDISPVNRSQSLEGMGALINAMKNINVPDDVQMKDARKMVLEQLSTVTDRGTADFILLNLKKLSDGTLAWTLNLNALEKNMKYIRRFPEIDKKYMGQVLFIGGTKSDFMREDDLEKIKKWFPNAALEWIDAGHVIHFEKPADFIEMITKFINTMK